MAYQSIAAMLAEMRDLGWSADADSWEDYIASEPLTREDMPDIRSDIRSELESMRNRATLNLCNCSNLDCCADH